MAAGKSTLARDLANRENAVLLVQNDLLDAFFLGEITDIQCFVKRSSRLKKAHICALLSKDTLWLAGVFAVELHPAIVRADCPELTNPS
jgi:hypothetical protein